MSPRDARSAPVEIGSPASLHLALAPGERVGSPPPDERQAATPESDSGSVPAAAHESDVATGPFQDLPGWIWLIFLGGWAAFFGQLLIFFTTSRMATFMVVISAMFAIFAFGLVIALAAQGRVARPPSAEVIHTHSGDLSPGAAAAQVALIPVAVAIGLAAFVLLAL